MRKQIKYILTTLLIPTLFSCKKAPEDIKLFEKIPSSETNITFSNHLTDTKDFGILDYLYFYNGAGVASGDINNDGLVDLFFVSNQGENKLYLNKGDLRFEDISQKAGIKGNANWKTGVTIADVNGDGFLDIYVCAVGKYKSLKGRNEFYINNKNGTFSEQAKEYGLDFAGFSTQAAFFDYDKDGDLDCFILNHAVHTSRSHGNVSTRTEKDEEAGDYLFENVGGKFQDVSEKSGIFQATMGYGLGLAIADVNNDGWEDIYVSNDFHEDDYLYINQKSLDGSSRRFVEEGRLRMKHTSRFSMGSDIADINNDGFLDVMTLDMYPEDEAVEKNSAGEDPLDIFLHKLEFGYFYQYSRNCLQLNQGGKNFIDIAALAGVVSTDWSWSVLMNDFDGDGLKDIFVANGIVRRPNDLNYIKYSIGDNVQEGFDQKALALMPEGKVHNYFFKGNTSLQFEDKSVAWGFEEANISNGATYADLDNDGDLEIITNNINEEATIYKNQNIEKLQNRFCKINLKGESKNIFGIGAKVIIKAKGIEQTQQNMPTRGFMSAVAPILTFGLGKNTTLIDTIKVIWESGKVQILSKVKPNTTLIFDEKNAQLPIAQADKLPIFTFEEISNKLNINFIHKENQYFDFTRESLMPFKVSTEGPKMAIGDVNGDGKDDLYVCGARNQAGELFLQKKSEFLPSKQISFQEDAIFEEVDAIFLDIDNDKDLDLYVVSGGNEFFGNSIEQFDRIYLNDGKGNFTRYKNALPPMFSNKSCVRPFDFDKDGDLDLFVGGRVVPFNYGKTPKSYLLVNNGKGNDSSTRFTDKTKALAPEIENAGMVTNAIWADIDKDGDTDLTVIGDWMPIQTYENINGKFKKIDNGISENTGFWQGIVANDFDKDGDIDFVVGNLGTNTKFRKNSNVNRLKMFVKDIDKNESVEQILVYNREDKWFPIATKDEMGKQIPSIINKHFTDNSQYAGKEINDLLTSDELDGAEEKQVNTFESVYVENLGGNKFKLKPLPTLAQTSKIMTLLLDDYDGDGIKDVIVGGNFYGSNMYQARYDGSYGLILKSDGKGNFKSIIPSQSGLLLNDEIRDIQKIMVNKLPYYLIARNNTTLQIFKKKYYGLKSVSNP